MAPRKISKRRLTIIFAALADPTRRDIYERLGENEELTVSDLATGCPMSAPAVTKHLRVLEEAGLIARRVDGRTHWIRRVADPLEMATAWMEEQMRAS